MLDSTNRRTRLRLNEAGLSIVELLVVIGISSMLLVAFLTVSLYMYGDTIRSTVYSQMATESSRILRSVVEELRQSSSIRTSNANPDANAPGGGWTTSNSNLILIISVPAVDSNNEFIMDPDTGYPFSNEIVYFASGNRLYKRYLAHANASGNTRQTTCPEASASSTCPPDILMSSNFRDMNFVFYDQDDAVTANIPDARSIKLIIQMQRQTFGKSLQFDNNIRITIRNTAS